MTSRLSVGVLTVHSKEKYGRKNRVGKTSSSEGHVGFEVLWEMWVEISRSWLNADLVVRQEV